MKILSLKLFNKLSGKCSQSNITGYQLFTLALTLLLSFSSYAGGKNVNTNNLVSSLQVDYYYPKYYIRWLATNLKDDGMFLIQEQNGNEYKTVHHKFAIGVDFQGPLLYCVTLVDSSDDRNVFRIKYRNTKGDTLLSEPAKTTIKVAAPSLEPDFVKIKFEKDSLYDEVAIVVQDKTSAGIIKNNLFQNKENPLIYFRSGHKMLCLQTLPALKDSMVPIYLEHATGGIYTVSFESQIEDPKVNIYLKNESTNEIFPVTNQKILDLYVRHKNTGRKPAFSLIFTTKDELKNNNRKSRLAFFKKRRSYTVLQSKTI